jgi:hypothetical protein
MPYPARRVEMARLETHAPKILTIEQCASALEWLALTLLVGLRP